MRILTSTITEEFEIDEDAVFAEIVDFQGKVSVEQFEAEIGPITDNHIIESFERHNGSMFGQELFSNVDFNVGYEVRERADDE